MRVAPIGLLLLAVEGGFGLYATQSLPRTPAFPARTRVALLSASADSAAGREAQQAPTASNGGAPELVAAAQEGDPRRVAVSGLQPQGQQQQQQQYVGVPPPGSAQAAPSPTFIQKARGPFMGLTFLATAGVAAWQSNQMYKRRQNALLEEFAATMVFHLGDEREMSAALQTFRRQLGPGPYIGRMFTEFLKAMASSVPIGVKGVKDLKSAVGVFGLSDAAAAKLLEQAADDLGRQPSVLGKLCFLSERALPMAASMAKLRTKFPNWSFDTVTALQRAMLENLYRELIEEDLDAPPNADTLQTLGLTDSDAARLTQEVKDRKAEEEREAAEKAAEEKRAQELEAALLAAAQANKMPVRKAPTFADEDPPTPPADSSPTPDAAPGPPPSVGPPAASDDDMPVETPGDGTHEYECTKCGYVLFPAAGREFKFFGAGFSCPQCGAGKEDFVDNGPVE